MIPLPKTCLGCPLFDSHKGFSQLEGDGSSGLMVIAESLGRAEEKDGLPLRPYAPSGGVFQRAANLGGINRKSLTILNTIRCKAEAPYPPEAIAQCKQYMDAAVEERKPRLILTLGDVPLKELSTTVGGISEMRGYLLKSRYGIPMIATYHPSFLARGAMHLLGVFLHDLKRAHQIATRGLPAPLPTNYVLTPKTADITTYLDRLRADPTLPVAYDIETEELLVKAPRTPRRIIQIQFSSAPGEAIVLGEKHFDGAREIFALPNPKWDFYGRLFDRQVLRRDGFTLNGELHDLFELYGHLQSGFLSNKDDSHGDKGTPSKLMSLQSCLSFYHPECRPWKSVEFPRWDGRSLLPLPVRLYGARDVDATVRVGLRQFCSLEKLGLAKGYTTFKQRLGSEVLDLLTETGLPIDKDAQTSLREHIETEELSLLRSLQPMVPEELQVLHPETGYAHTTAKVPWQGTKVSIESIVSNGYDPAHPPLIELSNSRGYLVQRMVTATVPNFIEVDCEATVPGKVKLRKCPKCKGTGKRMQRDGVISRDELRWSLSLFNPNSGTQVLNYIRWCVKEEREQMEPENCRWYVPTHIDTGKDSANKAGMERLIELTCDPVLKLIERCKKLTKLTDYCSGKWVPGEDGRVHAEFRFGSANNQTSATNPPVQTYPKHYVKEDEWIKPIMQRIKATIKAPPGYVMVEIDKVGFHARVQGFLAEDPDYYRLASLDCHSFVTAHYVEEPDRDTLLQLDDDALLARLKEVKAAHQHERDYMVKRISFLNQYGGGAEKAATILRMPVMSVQLVLDTIKGLFPKSFKDYPNRIKRQLQQSPRLVSAFGCTRTFWDGDMQQAVAFSVANPAHCAIQAELLRLHDMGALVKYGFCNLMHDAGWFCVREELADECIAVVKAEFERPSDVLVNSLGPFTCRSDAKVGPDMDSLMEVV